MTRDGWADNSGVRLHYLNSGPGQGTPLVFVPGGLGHAGHFAPEIAALAPRRCVAISLRGRGESDAPETGYSLAEQASDIAAVVDAAGLDRFGLMGYSLGVPVALRYGADHPERLAGLIVGDYPARYPAIAPEWVEGVLTALGDEVRAVAVRGIQRDAVETLLWDDLPRITCPALILRGGLEDAALSPEESRRYGEKLPLALIAVFEESGHDLSSPSFERYVGALRIFMSQIDMMG